MGIAHLKERMRDIPGIQTLTMTMAGGKQDYVLNGRLISLDAAAGDVAVEAAIRAAIAAPAIVDMAAGQPVTADTTAAAAVGLHPTIAATITGVPTSTQGQIMSSLQDKAKMLADKAKSVPAALHNRLDGSFARLSAAEGRGAKALDNIDAVISDVEASTAAVDDVANQLTNGGPKN